MYLVEIVWHIESPLTVPADITVHEMLLVAGASGGPMYASSFVANLADLTAAAATTVMKQVIPGVTIKATLGVLVVARIILKVLAVRVIRSIGYSAVVAEFGEYELMMFSKT